jgi:glycosyltransferase involved in cell wall biosynthesis
MRRARLLHLHHLTPIHAAAAAALPRVPVVTHLHGTELRMLAAIARAEPQISAGPHAQWWAAHMRAAARRAVATIAISPSARGEAVRLLDLDPETVHVIPNGVDVDRFNAHRPTVEERRAHWLRWLVCDPRGWDEATATPGSVAYTQDEVLDAFFDPTSGEPRPVLMFVGRFLAFKRVPLLLRAYAQARERTSIPAPLVICGGAPGEWEDEHPHTVATRERIDGVFFTGWRRHTELRLGLRCANCFVAPSTDEPFGLVYLEAMACQLPVIATLSGGPPSFINTVPGKPDGWLVPPDDQTALTNAIITAIDNPTQRTHRATNAARHTRHNYSWHNTAGHIAALYQRYANHRTSRHHS